MKYNSFLIIFSLHLGLMTACLAQGQPAQDNLYDEVQRTKQMVEVEIQKSPLLKAIQFEANKKDLSEARTVLQQTTPQKGSQNEALEVITQNSSKQAQSFLDNIDKDVLAIPEHVPTTSQRVIYFVSFSMPKPLLKTVLSLAAETPGTEVLFRGLKDQSNFITHQKALIHLIEKMEKKPKLGLDPLAFKNYQIDLVPSVVVHRENQVYKARGVISLEKMNQLIADLELDDSSYLGKYSETYEIAEMDLIELMKMRFNKIDWKKKGEEIKQNFWSGDRRFVILPKAKKNSQRKIPTLVEISDDIITPRGDVLARKGQRFDLAKDKPLSKWYLIVDATDQKQLDFIKTVRQQAKDAGRYVKVIFNRFNGELGWDEFNRLAHEIKQTVYILQPNMQKRFNIQAVPSLIRQKGESVFIEEFFMGET